MSVFVVSLEGFGHQCSELISQLENHNPVVITALLWVPRNSVSQITECFMSVPPIENKAFEHKFTIFSITGPSFSHSSSWCSFIQVMDNLLAQVTGRKRVVLYSPQDALHLYLSGKMLCMARCWHLDFYVVSWLNIFL